MLDSASVNSISSIPSPVYQWRKAFRRNIAVKYLSLKCGLAGCRNLEAEGMLKIQWFGWEKQVAGFMNIITAVELIKRHQKSKTFESITLDCHKITPMDPKKRLSETWMSGSATLLNISWMAVEFPAKATAIFKPLGGMSHTEACKTIYAGRSADPSPSS